MIVLSPSQGIIKDTKLDYDLISFILSQFIIVKRKTVLRVEKCRDAYSCFFPDEKLIKIDLKQGTSLKYIISTLLHEIRHFIQVKQFNSLRFSYKNYDEYYNSAEERDARKFEKLTTEVCKIYNNYQIIKRKFLELDLNSFRELSDNLNKQ
jgi:hypothetical protein